MKANDERPVRAGGMGRSFAFGAFVVLVAVTLFGLLASFQKSLESGALHRANIDERAGAGPESRIVEVTQAVKERKLVTVSIDTRVKVEAKDSSWRGDVAAVVEVPVKLLYGTDLSRLDGGSTGSGGTIAFNPLTGAYIVRVPMPERIATEVYSTEEKAEVSTGWMRLRSRAGEYYRGMARKQVADQAREMRLSNDDAAKVREATRERVEALVKRLVGEEKEVVVRVEERQRVADGGEQKADGH
jgi:hypothetical protein